jgi:cell division septation protein DedD
MEVRNNLVSEPSFDMIEQRLDHMKSTLESMEERLKKQLDEMMAALSIQFQKSRTKDPEPTTAPQKDQPSPSRPTPPQINPAIQPLATTIVHHHTTTQTPTQLKRQLQSPYPPLQNLKPATNH